MTNIMLGQIIKKAVLSEKTYKQMENGLYTFLVDGRSTKYEITKSVENQFKVNVLHVNVFKKAPKTKRISGTRKWTKIPGSKKAAVYLAPGQKIEILSPKTAKESKNKSVKGSKGENVKQEEKSETKEKKGLLSRIKR